MMKSKFVYGSALDRAETKAGPDLDRNSRLDPRLRFIPNHPRYPALLDLLKRVVAEMCKGQLPPGLRPPIATGREREPIAWRTAETLLANLIRALRTTRVVSLSMNPAKYAVTALSGSGIVNLVHLGDARKLWKWFAGYRLPVARESRLRPRRCLKVMFKGFGAHDTLYAEPDHFIVLRDGIGKTIQKKDWQFKDELERVKIQSLENEIRHLNSVFRAHLIRSSLRHLYPVLFAVFNRRFERGGRFYTGAGGHTNLRKLERQTITIDGKETIECDFTAMHIRILYNLAVSIQLGVHKTACRHWFSWRLANCIAVG